MFRDDTAAAGPRQGVAVPARGNRVRVRPAAHEQEAVHAALHGGLQLLHKCVRDKPPHRPQDPHHPLQQELAPGEGSEGGGAGEFRGTGPVC